MTTEQEVKIKELLSDMHDMVNNPDWCQASAEEIMARGNELFEEIFG